nr:ATP-dependent DNA helicase PIF1-like [Tanacetum cinerariifolium]
MFFVYGYGGTGKTYLYKTMSAKVEDSMCYIGSDSELAELIRKAKLIIWDEAPMINKHCYESFDRALRDIYRTNPVLRLTVNMRLGSRSTQSKKEIQEFEDWILDICNGKVSGANDSMSTVVFPNNMLIPETVDDVDMIIDDTYRDILQNLWNLTFFQEKSIIAPIHEMVNIINQRMLSLLRGDEKDYESLDSICLADEDFNFDDSIYTTEFLNDIRMFGLCNGTRIQVLRMGNNIIEAKTVFGGSVGRKAQGP